MDDMGDNKWFERSRSAAWKSLLLGGAALFAVAPHAYAQGTPGTQGAPKTPEPQAAQLAQAAQQAPAAQSPKDAQQEGKLEEIVVTARRESENLQKVPVAVTALTGEKLEQRDVRSLVEVARFTPGLTFDRGSNVNGGSISASVYMRGVGQRLAQPTADPAVGLYVDGIYLGRVVGSVLSVVDAERVEVLRGPQGTLFGRNTLGGAINITSRLPRGELGGYVDVGVGDYDELNLRAAADIPLAGDKLAARISVASQQHDGYDHNVITGKDMGSLNSQAARAVLRWRPADNFRANFFFDATDEHDTAQAVQPTLITATSALNPIYADGSRTAYGAGLLLDRQTNDLKAWGAAAYLEWDLARNVMLTSITGYRWMKTHVGVDADGTPLTYNENEIFDRQDQISQELRLNGHFWNNRLRWQFGAFFAKEKVQDINFIHRRLVANIPGTFVNIRQQLNATNRNWAVFGQATFKILESLSLTAGIRYSHEHKKEVVQSQVSPPLPPVGAGFPPTPLEGSWNSTTPRISLEYSPSNNFLTYISYAQGFKSGGFNYVTLFRTDLSIYNPEKTATWEAGIKSQLFDRHLRANLAVFHTTYKDLQFESFFAPGVVCPTFCSRTLNAAEAKIKGAELELTAAPARGLDLFANVAYMRNKVTKVDSRALNLVNLNSVLPRTPKWTATVGGSYRFDVSQGTITLTADYSFRSLSYFDFSNQIAAAQDDLGLFNAGVSFETRDKHWQFSIVAKNITNKLYASSGTGTTVRSDGYAFVFYGPPRTITASVRYRFGAR